MKHYTLVVRNLLWILAASLGASPLMAQDQSGGAPKPAAQNSALFATNDSQQDADVGLETVQPDHGPLSGIQNPTIGSTESRHSYWVPGIQYSNTVRSNSLNNATNSGWNTTNFVSTELSLLENWGHSSLSANYSGGGYFSTDQMQGHGQFQQLAANYEIDGKRWQAVFLDQFSYLPQSSFGFGGASGLSMPGVGGALAVPLPGLQPGYAPGQTILTVIGARYSNSSAAQLTYKVSARGAVTVAGVYSMLHFVDPGNINNDTEMVNVGYDYSVTRRDSIGLSYRLGAYRFPGDPQAIGDQMVQFEYGKKITGRMGLKLTAGPEITTFRVPIGGLTQRTSGSGSASLTYAFGAGTNTELHYVHGVSGGSGVFSGAVTDQADATLNKKVTRVWNGNLNFGYAKNRQILAPNDSPVFDTWFAGANLKRAIGHMTELSLGYQAQILTGNAILGSTANAVHQIYLSFQWHTRPFVLR